MLPFGIWTFVGVALVGATVALTAKAYGRYFSDWIFRGIGLGCFAVTGFIMEDPNAAMISTFGTILAFIILKIYFVKRKLADKTNQSS